MNVNRIGGSVQFFDCLTVNFFLETKPIFPPTKYFLNHWRIGRVLRNLLFSFNFASSSSSCKSNCIFMICKLTWIASKNSLPLIVRILYGPSTCWTNGRKLVHFSLALSFRTRLSLHIFSAKNILFYGFYWLKILLDLIIQQIKSASVQNS